MQVVAAIDAGHSFSYSLDWHYCYLQEYVLWFICFCYSLVLRRLWYYLLAAALLRRLQIDVARIDSTLFFAIPFNLK